MDMEPIAKWHADHIRFGDLLNALEKEVAAIHRGDQPNYPAIRSVIDQLHDDGDKYHHPREEVAFTLLLAKKPEMRPIIQRLRQEHQTIATTGDDLLGYLHAFLVGEPISREKIETMAGSYLVHYRLHMDAEERHIMPEVAKLLTPDDWKAVAEARLPV